MMPISAVPTSTHPEGIEELCGIPHLCALSQLGVSANGCSEPTLSPIPVLVGHFHVLLVNQLPWLMFALTPLSTH